jgi:hypothetical protein
VTSPASPDRSLDRLHDDLQAEYAKLVDIVNGFDQRLLTIKGWGVTLSQASLGLGFQQDHYGLFLVAATSGFAFWLLEATTKMHQIHYYPRMRDIEFIAYELFAVKTPSGPASSPLIDWGWTTAGPRIRRVDSKGDPRVPQPWPKLREGRSMQPWAFPHIMFPHLVAIVVGTVLFVLGLFGVFRPI